MSLLDDASIVVTPNGYKQGVLFSVIPSSGAADLEVTRGTAATRVDENGLVNYAEVIGGEEISCGNFECAVPLDYWTLASGWSIGGGKLSSSSTSTWGPYYAVGAATVGKAYKVKFSIVDYTSGTVAIRCGGTQSSGFSALGDYEVILVASVASNAFAQFKSSSSFTGSIDNISVKEVTRDNVPRIDYTGGGCPHILAEPQRTNLVTYSEDFSQWGTQDKIILTPNSVSSPSGDVNAYKIIPTSTSGVHKVRENLSTVSGDYTLSIFAKQGEYKNILLWDDILSGGLGVNLDDLSIFRNQNNQSYNIEDYGSGWVRISVTLSYSSQQILPSLYIYDNSATPKISFAGNDIDGLYIWGSQVEVGSYPTSYIPNFGTAAGVTRNQDIFTRDGIGSLINSTEGVLFAEIAALSNDGTNRIIALSDGTGNNLVRFYFSTSSSRVVAQVKVGGSTQVTFDITGITVTDFNKVALKYKENDFSIWINGTERGTDVIGTTPTGMNKLAFDDGAGSSNFFGKVKQLQVYDTSLSDTQLAALTS